MQTTLTFEQVDDQLNALADPAYYAFSQRLLPGSATVPCVRIPQLRPLAKAICAGDWQAWLEAAAASLRFEHILLSGMVIARARCDWDTRLSLLRQLLPRISNWMLCDGLCTELKCFRRQREAGYPLIAACLADPAPFYRRFGLVMLLDHYLIPAYLPQVLEACAAMNCDHPDVSKAVAWTLATAYTIDAEAVRQLLAGSALDDATHRRTLQKLRESRRVSAQDKQLLATLRRSSVHSIP